MKIICFECKNEIHNAKVYRRPKILTEYSPLRGNAHYVAVADIRTMCEKCGHVEDILAYMQLALNLVQNIKPFKGEDYE